MKVINSNSDYAFAKELFKGIPRKFTKEETLIKKKYLLTLENYELQINTLSIDDYSIIRYNSITNVILANEIIDRLNNNDDYAFTIMNSEIERINDSLTNIHMYTKEEMQYILSKHIDKKRVEEIINFLYTSKNKTRKRHRTTNL